MKNKETYSKGVATDQEKHTGEQGEFFTFDGSENLGVTDMFVDDGFDIIHQHAGEVHLSDLSPEEKETVIPKGSKKVKKTVLKPRLYKEPFNIKLTETAPKPGSSSARGIENDNLPYETEYLTLDEILNTVKSIPYYNEVLMDLKDDKEDWAVTQTVKRYADYWMKHPDSLTSDNFPPIQVIGDGLKDGAHRISTLNALANHIDPDNPYWKEVKLEVRFYPIEIVKDIGPTWVNNELVYSTDEGLQSTSLNEQNIPSFRNLPQMDDSKLNL